MIDWAERDRKRAEFEAEMAAQGERHRQEHIKIVADALRQHWERKDAMSIEECCAAVAVDALKAAGIVFGRFSFEADSDLSLNDGSGCG